MPTILRVGPYRFFFYSADCAEPPHIHVEHNDATAKFWLTPVRLQEGTGFNRRELRTILRIIEENLETLLRRWDEHCHD
jgi:hypothetical protein